MTEEKTTRYIDQKTRTNATDLSALYNILKTNKDLKIRKDAASYLLKLVEEGKELDYGEIKSMLDAEKEISVAAELKRVLNKLGLLGRFGKDPAAGYDRKLSHSEETALQEEIARLRDLYDRSVGEQGAFEKRYRITGEIDKGGMGRICRGIRVSDNRPVAVKYLLLKELSRNNRPERLIARFRREGELLTKRLKHPNIVEAYEYGEAGGEYFIVMEHIEGGTLESMLSMKPLDLKHFKTISLQLCEAVEYIHRSEVIHRDIKPLNILISNNNGGRQIKLADFGLAKDKRDSKVSKASFGAGSDDYSSPQQLENAALADQRDDIFSMGKTFYQMLTGRTFGKGEPYLRLNELGPGLPETLDALIVKCIATDRKERYNSVALLKEELRQIL